jgi:hypothetical protein
LVYYKGFFTTIMPTDLGMGIAGLNNEEVV